jgi:ferredoxin
MKISINEHICIGAGNCAQLAPTVFAQRESDGTVILLQESPVPSALPDVEKAVKICPAQAISVLKL